MATLTKSRARAPLAAEQQAALSYNHTASKIEFSLQADRTEAGRATYFNLTMTQFEFDKAVLFVRGRTSHLPHAELKPETIETAAEHAASLKRKGMSELAIANDAVKMAVDLLRFHMGRDEQANNVTFAYLASLVEE